MPQIEVTEEGIRIIEEHLRNLPVNDDDPSEGNSLDQPHNQEMLRRLRAGCRTPTDLRYYEHEILEAWLMGQDFTYRQAHDAVLKAQGLFYRGGDYRLYTPGARALSPTLFPPLNPSGPAPVP